MQLAVPLKRLGHIELGALPQKVSLISEKLWLADSARQDHFKPHRATRSLILRFFDDPSGEERPNWLIWRSLVNPILAQVREFYDNREGRFRALILANLPAGAEISPHIDSADVFRYCHRIHVPLLTSPEVLFTLDEQTFYLESGQAYEVNNLLRHGVKNASPQDRVHLIADYQEN